MWLLFACVAPPTVPIVDPTPAWREPTEMGGSAVGVRTIEVDDPRGGTLTAEVWYPAHADAEPVDYGLPYTPAALGLRDATPRGTGHPLVLFSHGHGGSRHQSVFLTERLASHGFVVVGVDHPHDTLFDLDRDRTPEVAARRPDDLRIALDHVLQANADGESWLRGRIRPDRIGVVGHSFGAWTALVLGGGQVDAEAAAAHCETENSAGCRIIGSIEIPDIPLAPDPRVTVTVALAPGGAYSFSDLSDVAPVLVVAGRADEDLPFEEEQLPVFERLGDPRTLMVLEGGGHFGFTDICVLAPVADCAGEADGFMDSGRMQFLTAASTTAFLGLELLDEPRYAPWLGEAWSHPDVDWR